MKIGLAYYEENLDGLDDIREELGSKIRNERVDDYASKTLSRCGKRLIGGDKDA